MRQHQCRNDAAVMLHACVATAVHLSFDSSGSSNQEVHQGAEDSTNRACWESQRMLTNRTEPHRNMAGSQYAQNYTPMLRMEAAHHAPGPPHVR